MGADRYENQNDQITRTTIKLPSIEAYEPSVARL